MEWLVFISLAHWRILISRGRFLKGVLFLMIILFFLFDLFLSLSLFPFYLQNYYAVSKLSLISSTKWAFDFFFQFYIYNIAYSSMGSNSFIGHFNCSSLNCWIVIVCLLLTPSNVFNHFLRQEFSKMVWLGEQIVFRLAKGPLVHLLIISMTDDTTVGVSRLGIVQVEPALLFSVLISIEFICGSSSFVCLGSE